MSFEIKEDDMQKPISREQRIAALRQELSDLKAELRKTKGQYKRATIRARSGWCAGSLSDWRKAEPA